MDLELMQLRLAYHEAMVLRLQDKKPELALIWLQGVEILTRQLASWGSVPESTRSDPVTQIPLT
jgi:hypothetical protein